MHFILFYSTFSSQIVAPFSCMIHSALPLVLAEHSWELISWSNVNTMLAKGTKDKKAISIATLYIVFSVIWCLMSLWKLLSNDNSHK